MKTSYEMFVQGLEKKTVRKKIDVSHLVDSSDIQSMIDSLKMIKQQYADTPHDFYVLSDYNFCIEYIVTFSVLETDEEFETRTKELYEDMLAIKEQNRLENQRRAQRNIEKKLKREQKKALANVGK